MDSPIWLFMGPEIGERNTAVENVKTALSKKYGDVETHTLYAGETDIGNVISLLQNASLFSPAKLVVLKSAELIKKKEDAQLLTDWIKSAAAQARNDSFLILVSDETSILKKISDAVPKDRQKIFWELFENKKQEWIKNFFAKEQIKTDGDAADKILELVENNTDALKTACSHLALFLEKGSVVSADDIEKLFAHNKEESPFTLFNSLTLNDFENAASIAQKLMLSKNSSPIQIIAGLAYCFRRLCDWHKIHEENGFIDEFGLKRYGFSGKTAIGQYGRAAKLWNLSACTKIVSLLAETDLKLRSMGTAMQKNIMELCLYEIVCRSGNNCAEYEPFR